MLHAGGELRGADGEILAAATGVSVSRGRYRRAASKFVLRRPLTRYLPRAAGAAHETRFERAAALRRARSYEAARRGPAFVGIHDPKRL